MKAFTLPSGMGVLLHELSQADWDALRKWAQKTYISDISSAVSDLSEQMQYVLVREAVDAVTNTSFNLGLCLEILFGSPVGIARVHYQMIDNPILSFHDFFKQIFPHNLYLREGVEAYTEGFVVLNSMCETVYGAPIDKVFWSTDALVNNEEVKEEQTEEPSVEEEQVEEPSAEGMSTEDTVTEEKQEESGVVVSEE